MGRTLLGFQNCKGEWVEMKYRFKFLQNVMEFIKPLISEGYEVNVKVVKKPFPRENDIDYFLVEVKE